MIVGGLLVLGLALSGGDSSSDGAANEATKTLNRGTAEVIVLAADATPYEIRYFCYRHCHNFSEAGHD